MSNPERDPASLVAERVEQRLAEIRSDPRLFRPYDLDGNGRLDEAELGRLREVLVAEEVTRLRRVSEGRASAEVDGAVSEVVGGRFEVLREIGRGGQARTFLARDRESGRTVALKRLLLAQAESWKAVELFEREAAVLQSLDHPRIPAYVGASHEALAGGEGGQSLYLAQEYVEGRTLEELVAAGQRFTEEQVRGWMVEILEILDYLHGQTPPVVHRDLKPSNLIRRSDGQLVLIDFGAIGDATAGQGGMGSTIIGTSGYMAPEQFMGRSGPPADLYALGATAVRVLSHRHPSELPLDRMRLQYADVVRISPQLRHVLDRLLAPNPEDRFQTAREVIDALQGRTGPPARKATSSAAPVLIGGAVVALLVVLGMVGAGAIYFVAGSAKEPQGPMALEPAALPPELAQIPNAPRIAPNALGPARTATTVDGLAFTFTAPAALSGWVFEPTGLSHEFGSTYALRGFSANGSTQEIAAARGMVVAYSAGGAEVGRTVTDLLPSFYPPQRPGDRSHLNLRFELDRSAAARIEVQALTVKHEAAPPGYPAATPLDVRWQTSRPQGAQLAVGLREDRREGKLPFGSQYLYLEVRNDGKRPLELLKLGKRIWGEDGSRLKADSKLESYVVAVSDPPFAPGDVLTVNLLSTFHPAVGRFEVYVVDAR